LLKLIDHTAEEDFTPQHFADFISMHHNSEILLDALFYSEISCILSEEQAV